MSTLKLALDRLTVAVKRAEGRTAPWSEGATVDTAGAIPAVVLDSDASQTPRPVSANWAGPVTVGQRVRVEHAGTRTVITHAPDDTGWQPIPLAAGVETIASVPAGYSEHAITFPSERFSSAPSVTVQVSGSPGRTVLNGISILRITSVSTTQVQVYLQNSGGSTVTSVPLHWQAIQRG